MQKIWDPHASSNQHTAGNEEDKNCDGICEYSYMYHCSKNLQNILFITTLPFPQVYYETASSILFQLFKTFDLKFLNPIIELNVENIMIMMDLPIVIIFTCFNLAGTSNWYNHWMYNRHGPTVVLIRIQPWTCLKFVKRSVGLIKEERHISDLDSKKKAWK